MDGIQGRKIMIRVANEKDIDAIHRWIEELEEIELPMDIFQRTYQEELDSDRWTCLVYEEDGKIQGVLNMRMEEQLQHPYKVAEILEFIVSKELRGKGIGRKLFEEAIRIAKENDCGHIELCSNMRRKNAHAFYEHMGMVKDHYNFVMKI